MRVITLTYRNDDGDLIKFEVEATDLAIHDLIRVMENADGNDEYEEGEFAGDAK